MDAMIATGLPGRGERITLWYGCNVMRHGDIVHACLDVLRALGYDASPAGGPDFCCGSTKDANLTAADGMAQRTVDKLNRRGAAQVVSWCPSCHAQSLELHAKGYDLRYENRYFVELLYENRDALGKLFVHPVPMRVFLHRHMGFNDKVAVNTMVPEILSLIPGVEVIEDDLRAPGYMCAHLATVPAAMAHMVRETEARMQRHGADALVTLFHQCQRELCGLETEGGKPVYNYMQLVARAMGLEYADEYKDWRRAGAGAAALVGPQRLEKVGAALFERAIVPELVKKTTR